MGRGKEGLQGVVHRLTGAWFSDMGLYFDPDGRLQPGDPRAMSWSNVQSAEERACLTNPQARAFREECAVLLGAKAAQCPRAEVRLDLDQVLQVLACVGTADLAAFFRKSGGTGAGCCRKLDLQVSESFQVKVGAQLRQRIGPAPDRPEAAAASSAVRPPSPAVPVLQALEPGEVDPALEAQHALLQALLRIAREHGREVLTPADKADAWREVLASGGERPHLTPAHVTFALHGLQEPDKTRVNGAVSRDVLEQMLGLGSRSLVHGMDRAGRLLARGQGSGPGAMTEQSKPRKSAHRPGAAQRWVQDRFIAWAREPERREALKQAAAGAAP